LNILKIFKKYLDTVFYFARDVNKKLYCMRTELSTKVKYIKS